MVSVIGCLCQILEKAEYSHQGLPKGRVGNHAIINEVYQEIQEPLLPVGLFVCFCWELPYYSNRTIYLLGEINIPASK